MHNASRGDIPMNLQGGSDNKTDLRNGAKMKTDKKHQKALGGTVHNGTLPLVHMWCLLCVEEGGVPTN